MTISAPFRFACLAVLAAFAASLPASARSPSCSQQLQAKYNAGLTWCDAAAADDRKQGRPLSFAACIDEFNAPIKKLSDSLDSTWAAQQGTRCGQYCARQHPNACVFDSPYATCFAQCNSGPMPKGKTASSPGKAKATTPDKTAAVKRPGGRARQATAKKPVPPRAARTTKPIAPKKKRTPPPSAD